MYTRNIPGSFYPVKSSVHKLNVIMKLMNFLIYILVIIGSKSLELHLFIFAFIILQILISKVPLKYYFDMFYSARYVYIILIFIFASWQISLETAIVYLLKIIMTLEYLALITYTSSPSELHYGITRMLNPINFLNLNLDKIANLIISTINFIPTIVTTEQSILKSQASRGLDYYHSGIFGKIYAVLNSLKNTLRLTIKRKKEIKLVSSLRMNFTGKKRTNLNINKVGLYDIIFSAFSFMFLIGYIMEVNLI